MHQNIFLSGIYIILRAPYRGNTDITHTGNLEHYTLISKETFVQSVMFSQSANLEKETLSKSHNRYQYFLSSCNSNVTNSSKVDLFMVFGLHE